MAQRAPVVVYQSLWPKMGTPFRLLWVWPHKNRYCHESVQRSENKASDWNVQEKLTGRLWHPRLLCLAAYKFLYLVGITRKLIDVSISVTPSLKIELLLSTHSLRMKYAVISFFSHVTDALQYNICVHATMHNNRSIKSANDTSNSPNVVQLSP